MLSPTAGLGEVGEQLGDVSVDACEENMHARTHTEIGNRHARGAHTPKRKVIENKELLTRIYDLLNFHTNILNPSNIGEHSPS